MIDLPNQERFANVLPLIRTLFKIVLLRKGPEDLPPYWLIFVPILGLWLFSALSVLALIDRFDESDFFLGLFSGAIGVLCYGSLVVLSGRPERVLQTISAVIGCGALISFAFLVEYVLLLPLLGEIATGLIANLILLWSVPVEGHIIARAIDRHWYIGILVAIAVFALQLVIYSAVTATP
jgi:hypothetical protein